MLRSENTKNIFLIHLYLYNSYGIETFIARINFFMKIDGHGGIAIESIDYCFKVYNTTK